MSVLKTNHRPTNKTDPIRKYFKEFTKLVNEIPFDRLNAVQNSSNENSETVKPNVYRNVKRVVLLL